MLLNKKVMKKLLLLLSLVLVLFSCQKEEELPNELCVYPVGEFAESTYLYQDGDVYGDGGDAWCIESGFIMMYAEPVEGYTFVKWCGYLDSWNSPMTSRYSNPAVLGRYGDIDMNKQIELTPIYKKNGERYDNRACPFPTR